VSIGHRSTLKTFHNRILKLLPEGEYYRVYERTPLVIGRPDGLTSAARRSAYSLH